MTSLRILYIDDDADIRTILARDCSGDAGIVRPPSN